MKIYPNVDNNFNAKQMHHQSSKAWIESNLVYPSNRKYNLSSPNKVDYSQDGETKVAFKLLQQKNSGFFVEAGGLDGERFSNTLYFEKYHNWSGILIEPDPTSFQKLMTKNRKCYALNACLNTQKDGFGQLLFRPADAVGALDTSFRKQNTKPILVTCVTLETVLDILNVSHIDYFALDVEGSEAEIIYALNFEKISFSLLQVEYRGSKLSLEEFQPVEHVLKKILQMNGYMEIARTIRDIFFQPISLTTITAPTIFLKPSPIDF